MKLSNSQFNKLKFVIKNATNVTLRLSKHIIGTDETNFPQNLLLTNRQVSSMNKSCSNNSLINIKSSKTQLPKIIRSGRFLGRPLGPLMKVRLPLIKNVLIPSAKSLLIPLGLTAAPSTANAGIYRKILGSAISGSIKTTLTISNKEVKFIMKIVNPFEDPGLLIKDVTEQ